MRPKIHPHLSTVTRTWLKCSLALCMPFTANALDQNNDGMSDVWQRVYSIANGDTVSDPDKDGFSNLEEARAGTNPHDKDDYFKLTHYSIAATLDTADLSWRSLEGRLYDLEGSSDLVSWNSMESMRGIQGLHSSNTLSIPISPLNDNFESRLPTATDATQATGNNENATVQVGEADNPSVSGDNSVWWTWKPTIAGDVTISIDGSNFDTTLAIYTGSSLNSLVLIGSDDDGGSGTRSSITFSADPNIVYSIQVNGYSSHTGNIVLNHPLSAGTFDAPVAGDTKPSKMFFRVRGNQFLDIDADGDQLVIWEERLLGTDDTLSDTDGDKMTDSFEFIHGFDPLSPTDGITDVDGDGISNADEEKAGTDPNDPDSDNNGVNDGDEDPDGDGLLNKDELTIHNTSIFDPDSDDDRMPDGWEVTHSLNPNVNDANADPDTDNVNNLNEYVLDLDPNNTMSMALTNDSSLDRDSDGMPDSWEVLWVAWSRTQTTFTANHAIDGMDVYAKRLDWLIDDASEDKDYDTMTNLAEYIASTNPFQHDTDGDGLSDGWEKEHGFDPKVNNTTDSDPSNDPDADPDNDGLTNEEESSLNTDPNNPDSDGDGVSDSDENDQGSNPNDPNDKDPPPAGTVRVDITFGDPSGSHSEKYRVSLTPLAGDTTGHGVRFRTNRRYGQPQTDTFHLPIGAQYKVELMHIGTDPNYNGDPKPDYDYVFLVDSASCLGRLDPDGILGTHQEGNPFFATGKSVTFTTTPVFVTLNNTLQQADDLIAVSSGVDEDLATDITIQADGYGAVTANLSLKNADGDIKFKDATINLTDSTPATTKLWGITPSSAQNKTIIVIELKDAGGNVVCNVEQEVTVFKGVKLEIKGNFYINVDTREFGRRPWDGRVDPKPNVKGDHSGFSFLVWFPNANGAPINKYVDGDYVTALQRIIHLPAGATAAEIAAYKKAVDQSASFGYASAISFKSGDNPKIPLYKPWIEPLKVEVKKIFSKDPVFEIKGDAMIGSLLEMQKGHLNGIQDRTEDLVDPEIKIADYLILDRTTAVTKIGVVADRPSVFNVATHLTPKIAAARGTGFDELLDQLSYVGNNLLGLSGSEFKWNNDTFKITKSSNFTKSAVAKSLVGELEGLNKVDVTFHLWRWNEFNFQGDLKDFIIETK